MSAKHDHSPVVGSGGPGSGESGAAPDAEAGSRVASAPDPTLDLAGNDPAEAVRAPLPGEEREPEAALQPEAAAENHERTLEADLDELTAKAQKADEYLELAQRTKADFENYRKRATREAAAAQERGMAKLALELLPAVDNLDRALAAAKVSSNGDDRAQTLVSGIKLVHDDVIAALGRVGIEPFSPEGEPFDPQRHEAIAQQPVEGAQPGTVVEVYQRGYRLGETVLRPARVVVAG